MYGGLGSMMFGSFNSVKTGIKGVDDNYTLICDNPETSLQAISKISNEFI
jgi:hypothetical protein